MGAEAWDYRSSFTSSIRGTTQAAMSEFKAANAADVGAHPFFGQGLTASARAFEVQ